MDSGFLNIMKPPGMTSHDVVNCVRRIFRTRAVGHMGTLDPEAAGVLPLAVGRATRLIPFVEGDIKVYRAEIILGMGTDTDDIHGRTIAEADGSMVTKEQVAQALASFLGDIMQIPPMYSAIKVQGHKLYELARAGVEVDIKARRVYIEKIDLLSFQIGESGLSRALIEVVCGKGTYVRSLCRDVGALLGLPACMGSLLRLQSGPFCHKDGVTLEELEKEPLLINMKTLFAPEEQLQLPIAEGSLFIEGRRLPAAVCNGVYAILSRGVFLGLGRVEGEVLAPLKVLVRKEEFCFARTE